MIPASTAFSAAASHPNLEGNTAVGTLTADVRRLRFESEAITLEIPLVRIQIERPDPKGDEIVFRHLDDPTWEICCMDPAILEYAPLLRQPESRHQIENLQAGRELKRRLKITFLFLAGFGVLAFLISSMTGVMVSYLVNNIPPKYEEEFGNLLMTEVLDKSLVSKDAKLYVGLTNALKPLLESFPNQGRDFKFYVFEDFSPNAFALPGGHVIVNTALLDLAERPEHLCGVVAHEIAHVTKKHGFRKILTTAGPYLLFRIVAGDSRGLMGVLGGGSQLLIRQSFSQEYELEADAAGFALLVKARVDPRGLAEMLEKLERSQEKLKFPHLEPNAFRSHPATQKRIARLNARWSALKNKDFPTREAK